ALELVDGVDVDGVAYGLTQFTALEDPAGAAVEEYEARAARRVLHGAHGGTSKAGEHLGFRVADIERARDERGRGGVVSETDELDGLETDGSPPIVVECREDCLLSRHGCLGVVGPRTRAH